MEVPVDPVSERSCRSGLESYVPGRQEIGVAVVVLRDPEVEVEVSRQVQTVVFAGCCSCLPSGHPSPSPLALLVVVGRMTVAWSSTLKMILDSDESSQSSPALTPPAPKVSWLLLCVLLLAQSQQSLSWFSSSSWTVLE